MVAKPTITNDVCAVYARYSSDLQSPRSIVDQVERLRAEVSSTAAYSTNGLSSATARQAAQSGNGPASKHY